MNFVYKIVWIWKNNKLNTKQNNLALSKDMQKRKKSINTNIIDENKPIRINKFLAEAGVASRRKIDELILQGLIKVNGKTIQELGYKVLNTDFITVNGDPVKEIKHNIYILLNKPKNIITTTSDEHNRKTVLDIVKKDTRIFPIGRLDRNTTGVLLLTNDGEIAFRLTHPKYLIERTYSVKLDKELKENHAKSISEGIVLDDGDKTRPCELFINPTDNSKVIITLTEGKNREVRRIFEQFGYEVKQLDRKIFAGLTTKGLNRGDYRHLTKEELMGIRKLTKLIR